MLTFAVVASRIGRPVPERVAAVLRDQTCREVPFRAQSHLVWSNESQTVWFAGWQDRDDDPEHHWHVGADGLTAFAGKVWPRLDGWADGTPWARQLAAHLDANPLAHGTDHLGGAFVAASLSSRGHSYVAADPLGFGLAHVARADEVTVVATRAALAARLRSAATGTRVQRDPYGSGWLAYSINLMGRSTGFRGVEIAPSGAVLHAHTDGGLTVESPDVPVWRQRAEELRASPLRGLEEARTEMATAIRAGLSLGPVAVDLTGGKDTRTMLALVLAEGLADRVEFQTSGTAGTPDVQIAEALAARYGLRHVLNPNAGAQWAWRHRNEAALRAGAAEELSWREISLRLTSWATGGVRTVSDVITGRLPGEQVVLSGLCAELMRTNYPASARFRSKREVQRLPSELRFGSAGILRRSVAARYHEDMQAFLFEHAQITDSPQDVVDAFFLTNRMRRWFGPTLELDPLNRVFPLYSLTGTRLAFAIGAESRHAEWIQHRLIRDARAELVNIGFDGESWPVSAAAELIHPQDFDDPVPSGAFPARPPRPERGAPKKQTAMRAFRALTAAEDVSIMRRHLLDERAGPADELIDRAGAAAALDRFDELGHLGRQQLFGALSVALWLGEHEIEAPRHPTA